MQAAQATLIIAVGTFTLFALGAFRILLQSERLDKPLFNFVNLSNILIFTFDIVRNLLYYLFPVFLFLTWPTFFWGMVTSIHWCVLVAVCLGCLSVAYWYRKILMTRKRDFLVKYVWELGLFLSAALIKEFFSPENFVFVESGAVILFLYGHVKISHQYELYLIGLESKKRTVQIINFKSGNLNALELPNDEYAVESGREFIFIEKKDKSSFSIIQMSEVRSIEMRENIP
jgi:hypothetical protein